jgi:serine/threonine protein kinase
MIESNPIETKDYYHSGWMKKKGKIFGKWSNYYCELIENHLYIRKTEQSPKIDHHYIINTETTVSLTSKARDAQLEVKIPGVRRILLRTDSVDTLRQWQRAFGSSISSQKMLTPEKFEFVTFLGGGFYGKVFLVKEKRTGRYFALKTVKKGLLQKYEQTSTIYSERNILVRISHPFIVQMHFAFQTASRFYLGMEYLQGGDLFGLMERVGRLSAVEARLYAFEVALSIEHLHSRGIVFRDLKAENVLICRDGHVKLADFGLAEDISGAQTADRFCGTAEFVAPEIVAREAYSFAVDWWAFGVLVFQMLFGRTPFHAETVAMIYANIKTSEVLWPREADMVAIDFIDGFLTKDPRERATLQSAERHPFWGGLRREDVLAKRIPPPFVPQPQTAASAEYFQNPFTPHCHPDYFSPSIPQSPFNFPDFSFLDESFFNC